MGYHDLRNISLKIVYADYILLLIEGNSKQLLLTWCKIVKLLISIEKTTYALRKRNLQRNPLIRTKKNKTSIS